MKLKKIILEVFEELHQKEANKKNQWGFTIGYQDSEETVIKTVLEKLKELIEWKEGAEGTINHLENRIEDLEQSDD